MQAMGSRSNDLAGSTGSERSASWRIAAEAISLVLVLAASFWVRWTVYDRAELGLDGYLSVGLASIGIRELLEFSIRDVHPPLYYLALKLWLSFVGPGVSAAKAPSIVCGLLGIVVLGRIARLYWGPLAGLVVAALLGLTPAHVYLSATARDFVPGFLLSLILIWLLLVLIRDGVGQAATAPSGSGEDDVGRSPNVALTLLVVVNALALYTWYFHIIFVAVLGVTALVFGGSRRWRIVSCLGLSGLAYLPWIGYAVPALLGKLVDGITVGGQARAWAVPGDVLRSVGPNLVGELPSQPGQDVLPLPLVVAWLGFAFGAAVVGLGSSRLRRDAPAFLLSISGLTLGVLVVYLLRSGWVGGDNPSRYLLVVIPFGLLSLVGVTSRIPSRGRALARIALGVLLIPGFVAFRHSAAIPPIPWMSDPSILYVNANARPGDALLFSDLSALGQYRLYARGGLPTYQVHFAGSPFLWSDVERDAPLVTSRLAAGHSRVWFVNSSPHLTAPTLLLNRELAERFYFVEQRWETKSTAIRLFVTGSRPALRAIDASFGGQIALKAAGATVSPGERAIYLGLEWEALRQPDRDYSVFVHAVDSSGGTVAQKDGWPGAGLMQTSALKPGDRVLDYCLLSFPAGAPSGQYDVRVGLYSGDSRLTLPDGANYVTVAEVWADASGLVVEVADR